MSTFYTIPICLSWFVYNIYNLYLYINTFFMYSLNEFSPSFFKVQKSYLVEQQFFLSIYCLQCSPLWKIIVDKSCGKIRKKVRIKKSLFSNKNHSYFILKKKILFNRTFDRWPKILTTLIVNWMWVIVAHIFIPKKFMIVSDRGSNLKHMIVSDRGSWKIWTFLSLPKPRFRVPNRDPSLNDLVHTYI